MDNSSTPSPEPAPSERLDNRQLSDRIVLEIVQSRAPDPSRVTPDASIVDLDIGFDGSFDIISRLHDILANQGINFFSLLQPSAKTTIRELQNSVWNAIGNLQTGIELRHPAETQQTYVDLRNEVVSLVSLQVDERELVARLRARAQSHPSWNDFENFWTQEVVVFYGSLSHRELLQTVGYRIGQDLGDRLAIAAGRARRPDYRDELAEIIRTHFRTRREFCEVAGLTESMLSQVLSGRKSFSLEKLQEIMDRIGYQLRFVPRAAQAPATSGGEAETTSETIPESETPRRVVQIDVADWKVPEEGF